MSNGARDSGRIPGERYRSAMTVWLAFAVLSLTPSCRCGESTRNAAPPDLGAEFDAGPPRDTRPERVVLTRVVVEEVEAVPEIELYPAQIAKELSATLTDAPWFEARQEDVSPSMKVRPAVLQVRIHHEEMATEGGMSLLVTVEAALQWEDGGSDPAPTEQIALEHELMSASQGTESSGPSRAAIISREVGRAAALAAHGLIAKEGVRSGDTARVIEALGRGDDPTVQGFAIEVARARRLSEARPALESLLVADVEQREAVIGALVAIGDPASVRALADLPTRGRVEVLHTAIEAIGLLGGEDAEAYLEVVSTGHPDPEIRAHAATSLAELVRRQSAAAAAVQVRDDKGRSRENGESR